METGPMEGPALTGKRGWVSVLVLLVSGLLLAACSAPVGMSPALRGTYWQSALVTNPDGDGPQVVRWGPPQNWNPGEDNP